MGKTIRESRRGKIAAELDPTDIQASQSLPDHDFWGQGEDPNEPEVPRPYGGQAPPAPAPDARVTLGLWDYAVFISPEGDSADKFTIAASRRRSTRAFATSVSAPRPARSTAGLPLTAALTAMVAHGPVAGLAINPGAHALYALSGQGKSRTLTALHARLDAHEAIAHYDNAMDDGATVSVVLPRHAACVAAQAGEPDGRYDPALAGMAAAIAWAMLAPGRLVTVDSVTDLSRASGDGGTMGGGLSSGFATDLRHLSAALLACGSAALLVVNPLAEGSAAGLFREVLFGSLTGLWVPTELGASAPTGQQRGAARGVAGPMWGGSPPPSAVARSATRAPGLLVPELSLSEPTLGLPFGRVVRPFTY